MKLIFRQVLGLAALVCVIASWAVSPTFSLVTVVLLLLKGSDAWRYRK